MAQYLRPNADIATNGWVSTPLYTEIDEASYSDGDSIQNNSISYCEVSLSSASDPVSSSAHYVRYRIGRSRTDRTLTLVVRLMEGSTQIAAWTHIDPAASFVGFTQTLTSGEADSITDYSNLRLRFDITAIQNSQVQGQVSWAEMEVPDAGVPPVTIQLAAGSLSASGPVLNQIPGARAIALLAGSVQAAGLALTVQAAASAITIQLAAGSIAASGPVLGLVPGTRALALAAGLISAAGPVLDLVPGNRIILLAAGLVQAAGQTITVISGGAPPVTIQLAAGSVALSGPALDIIPGPRSIGLSAALIQVSGLSMQILPGPRSIQLSAAVAAVSGPNITLYVGATPPVVIGLAAGLIQASGPAFDLLPGPVSLQLESGIVTVGGQNIQIIPGTIGILLSAAAVQADGQILGVFSGGILPIVILLSTAEINAQGGDLLAWQDIEPVVLSLDDKSRLFELSANVNILRLEDDSVVIQLKTRKGIIP